MGALLDIYIAAELANRQTLAERYWMTARERLSGQVIGCSREQYVLDILVACGAICYVARSDETLILPMFQPVSNLPH